MPAPPEYSYSAYRINYYYFLLVTTLFAKVMVLNTQQ